MIRFPRVLGTLALLAACAPPVTGQNVVVDEGKFRLFDRGREIGTDTFTIRRVGQGADARVIANSVIELDLPAGHQQVKPLLRAGADLAFSAYQVEVSGPDQANVAVTTDGRRFLTRTTTPTGEQDREFRAAPGSVVLDEGVAHQYWFLSQLAEGTSVPVLVPRAGSQTRLQVLASRPETIVISGAQVPARRVTFEIDGRRHDAWYDADGRVLKVSVPDRGFLAERTLR